MFHSFKDSDKLHILTIQSMRVGKRSEIELQP
jgi:hypothetical protein